MLAPVFKKYAFSRTALMNNNIERTGPFPFTHRFIVPCTLNIHNSTVHSQLGLGP